MRRFIFQCNCRPVDENTAGSIYCEILRYLQADQQSTVFTH